MVIGSVVMAFEEVCPERLDLIHKHYRKLCNLIIDVDEWGQIAILNILLRYARTQFLDPNQGAGEIAEQPFYESSESDEGEGRRPMTPRYDLTNFISQRWRRNSGDYFALALALAS